MKLIVIGGVPGTGKTTFARWLSQKTGWRLISKDAIKEALFDVCGYKDRAWSIEFGKLSFMVFRRVAELYLERGESVIVECPFLFAGDAQWLNEFATRFQAELVQYWFTAEPKAVYERFIQRASSGGRHIGHADGIESNQKAFEEKYFQSTFSPMVLAGETITVDTTDLSKVNYQELFEKVK